MLFALFITFMLSLNVAMLFLLWARLADVHWLVMELCKEQANREGTEFLAEQSAQQLLAKRLAARPKKDCRPKL